jgi:catechol 1,2-dioxygenase
VPFGATRALTGDYQRHDEPHPDRPDAPTPWYCLDYVFILEAGEARLPVPPIE